MKRDQPCIISSYKHKHTKSFWKLAFWENLTVRKNYGMLHNVPWRFPNWISCTKVIPYLAFACELECVYHDVYCWRTEWSWLQMPSCHVAKLGDFWKNFTGKVFMIFLSSIGLSMSLICSILPELLPLLCLTDMAGICGVWRGVKGIYLTQIYCKIKNWIHRLILIFTDWLG